MSPEYRVDIKFMVSFLFNICFVSTGEAIYGVNGEMYRYTNDSAQVDAVSAS